jgi:hypothetical protein
VAAEVAGRSDPDNRDNIRKGRLERGALSSLGEAERKRKIRREDGGELSVDSVLRLVIMPFKHRRPMRA